MQEIVSTDQIDQLLKLPLAVVFKHSTRCPTSAGANVEVHRFATRNPGVPVSVIRVIENREISNRLATVLGLKHESPQVIVLRAGEIVWHGSHYEIRAEELERRLPVASECC